MLLFAAASEELRRRFNDLIIPIREAQGDNRTYNHILQLERRLLDLTKQRRKQLHLLKSIKKNRFDMMEDAIAQERDDRELSIRTDHEREVEKLNLDHDNALREIE